MGVFLTMIAALALWIILWGVGLMKSFDAFVIALKTLYAGDGSARYGLVLDGEPFTIEAGEDLVATRGEAVDPDGVIAGAPGELAAVLWHGRPVSATGIERAGDTDAFFTLFPLPPG